MTLISGMPRFDTTDTSCEAIRKVFWQLSTPPIHHTHPICTPLASVTKPNKTCSLTAARSHACLAEGETYIQQQQPTASSKTRHAPPLFVYHWDLHDKISFTISPHSFSALSQIIDMDAQAYPPRLTTFVVSLLASAPQLFGTSGPAYV